MASGVALDDADRLPWLRLVREKALQLTAGEGGSKERSAEDEPTRMEKEKRELAEVRETSGLGEEQAKAPKVDASAVEASTANSNSTTGTTSASQSSRVVVIACSALKRSYRDVLRGSCCSLASSSSPPSSSSAAGVDSASSNDALRVIHIYLRVEASELQRRMSSRGEHFMKPDMLASQLATLEEPQPESEEGVFVVEDAPREMEPSTMEQEVGAALRTHSVHARFTIACPPGAETQVSHLPTQGSRSSIVAYPLLISSPPRQVQEGGQKQSHKQHLEAISKALGEVREMINEELSRQKEKLGKWDLVVEAKEERQDEGEEDGEEEEEEESD
jgi:gluconokinase